jgi:hypothetical protein
MSAAAFVTGLAAVFMFGYGPAFCLAVRLAERRDQKTVPAPELPNPLLGHPSLRTHQTVARIRDRIAAEEAARIDTEWEAMNR